MLAALRGLYAGTMAALQVPSGWLVERVDGRIVLAVGTALAAGGYALAGFTGSLVGLCAALAISGAGSSTQHPIASAAVSRAYGASSRGPLGTYNFTGDLGKAAIPALTSLLLTLMPWRGALWLLAALGAAVAAAVLLLMPPIARAGRSQPLRAQGRSRPRRLLAVVRHRRAGYRRENGVADLPAVPSEGERRVLADGWRCPGAGLSRRRGRQIRLWVARCPRRRSADCARNGRWNGGMYRRACWCCRWFPCSCCCLLWASC